MIRPKHSFVNKGFEIKEEFIDRTDAKALYHEKLNNCNMEYNILSFYGLGGIGKTTLRKEICRLHKEENKESIIFYVDFNASENRNIGTCILKLVDNCDTKIDFKCFEMAYALYFRKKNPGALYGREKEMITDNTVISTGLNILGLFDGGITGTAAEIVEHGIRAISNRVIDKLVKDELSKFDNYSIEEIEERLPMFFQYDLQNYVQKHPNAKILMIFDTFEALNENVIEENHRRRNERWVQDFISYFDHETFRNLLVIIFGREEIEWEDEWQSLIEKYKLVEFENEFAEQYLRKAGIEEEYIIKSIATNSKGYPLGLYLSAETYANIKSAGQNPSPDDFGGDYPEVLERFLYNLDKDTVAVLKLLSVPNFYNLELFDALVKEFNIYFSTMEYEQFNKYSFVDYNDGDYFINRLIRKSMLYKDSVRNIAKVHNFLLNYYVKKLENAVTSKDLIQVFYHARNEKNVEEFNDWLVRPLSSQSNKSPLDILKDFQFQGNQDVLKQIIEGIYLQAGYGISAVKIEIANIYIDMLHLGGEYDIAVDFCEKYLEKYSINDILGNQQLLKMRIRMIHHSMFFKPVNGLIEDAIKLAGIMDESNYPEEYNEILFLVGGNLAVLAGDFGLAEKWLKSSMDYATVHGFNHFKHRTVRKQADILLYRDEYEKAIALINPIVTKDSKDAELDSRYKIYLLAVLGEIYRKQGDLNTAWKIYDLVDEKCSENHIPGWQAHSYLAKGIILFYMKKLDESDNYLARALSIYKRINQKWGIITTKEAILLKKKFSGQQLEKAEVDECRVASIKMNYRYNEEYIDRLDKEEYPYLQLFFL